MSMTYCFYKHPLDGRYTVVHYLPISSSTAYEKPLTFTYHKEAIITSKQDYVKLKSIIHNLQDGSISFLTALIKDTPPLSIDRVSYTRGEAT